jgi:pimeloyl-ACP methyl ester carboxylesterase
VEFARLCLWVRCALGDIRGEQSHHVDEFLTLKDGATVATTSVGSGKSAVVLLHGLALDRRMWDECFAGLARLNLRILTYDARGHGESSPLQVLQATKPQHSALNDLYQVLNAYSVNEVHLVGHSRGGRVALRAAVDVQGLMRQGVNVASLTLFSANMDGCPPSAKRQQISEAVLAESRDRGSASALDIWAESAMFKPLSSRTQTYIKEAGSRPVPVITARWQQRRASPDSGSRDCVDADR